MTESDRQLEKSPAELGYEAGRNALDPLEEFSKTFGESFDLDSKKQFLGYYLDGVTQFFETRGLVMPIFSHMENIVQPQGLSGFLKGLKREKPTPKEKLKPPSGQYEDPETWVYTLRLISQKFYREGYFLGFMISLARDHNLNLNQVEVPKDEEQFELFSRGENAQPRVFTPSIGANFIFEEDQEIAIKLENWIYEGGLKLWLHKQKLDIELASKISHPEALEGFKQAMKNVQLDLEGIPENSPQTSGYQLGQIARKSLDK